MSTSPDSPTSLEERYRAPRPASHWVALGGVAAILGAAIIAAIVIWVDATQYHSDPTVSSELIGFEVVDDHTVTAVLRVTWGDEPVDDAECRLVAQAADKVVVGEVSFTPDPDQGPDHEVEISTERRATAVDPIGCTAPGQPRPR